MTSTGEAVAHKAHKALTGSHARTANGSPAARVDADVDELSQHCIHAAGKQSPFFHQFWGTCYSHSSSARNRVTQATTSRQSSTASLQPLAASSTYSRATHLNFLGRFTQLPDNESLYTSELHSTVSSVEVQCCRSVPDLLSQLPLGCAVLPKALPLLPKLQLLSHPHRRCNLQKQQQCCARIHTVE